MVISHTNPFKKGGPHPGPKKHDGEQPEDDLVVSPPPKARDWVYVVYCTYGDYIGYFDTEILGVFKKKKDADACKERNGDKLNKWSTTFIRVEEMALE